MRLPILLLFAVPACGALAMSHRPSLVAPSGTYSWQLRAHEVRACAEEDKLEQRFATELARRLAQKQASPEQQQQASPEHKAADVPFGGIREIVLDPDGVPRAIPKRPPPPPADTQGNVIASLLTAPEFVFGMVLTVGSLALLLVIANADAGA